jgi:hypothetical protein
VVVLVPVASSSSERRSDDDDDDCDSDLGNDVVVVSAASLSLRTPDTRENAANSGEPGAAEPDALIWKEGSGGKANQSKLGTHWEVLICVIMAVS